MTVRMFPTKNNSRHLKNEEKMDKKTIQIAWGALLVMAGLGVFYRIPQVMPKVASIESFSGVLPFIRFCFYFLGVLLIFGGGKKIYEHRK